MILRGLRVTLWASDESYGFSFHTPLKKKKNPHIQKQINTKNLHGISGDTQMPQSSLMGSAWFIVIPGPFKYPGSEKISRLCLSPGLFYERATLKDKDTMGSGRLRRSHVTKVTELSRESRKCLFKWLDLGKCSLLFLKICSAKFSPSFDKNWMSFLLPLKSPGRTYT